MKTNFYNSKDNNYEHVKDLLKGLPKVNAPDDFEFKLQTKIENKNFGLNSKERKGFNPWAVFVPVSGIVAASLLVFVFFFNSNSDSLENPFKIIPKLRSEISSNIFASTGFNNIFDKSEKINELDVIVNENETNTKNEEKVETTKKTKKLVEPAKPNGVKKDFPFANYASTNLDEVLKNKNIENSIGRQAQLAGRGTSRNYFNGFFLGEEVNKEYVDALKARLDSVKREILLKKHQSRRAE